MCFSPITIKDPKRVVPCGKCVECVNAHSTSWFIRINAEFEKSDNAYFITLTYNDDNNNGTLRKKDLQNLFKRYRSKVANSKYSKPFKYYAIGEYGGVTHRPHYHIIAFNVCIESILKEWTSGFWTQDKLNEARIRYCTNYIIGRREYGYKKKYAPFAIMSKGIGQAYMSEAMRTYHKSKLSSTVTLRGGQKLPLPRYLKERIWRCETAIREIGKRNREIANKEERSTKHDVKMSERAYKRIVYKRSKKSPQNL
jgi:hypothetical protein